MSILLGWIDSIVAGDAPAAVIDSMARGRRLGAGGRRSTVKILDAALSVDGAGPDGSLTGDGTLAAAITGRPRWERPELAELAARDGHAAALLEAYRRHGDELLQFLRGSFSLAVIAGAEKRALLAIDRIGVGTMCYSQPASGGLVFGPSTDVVRAHPAVTSTVPPQAIFNYLYFGISPSPGTIYREQSKLLPAQCLIYEKGALRREFYWQMPYRERNTRSLASLSEELMERLRAAVRRSIAGEDPARLGAFLSGGLDSSTVAGLLSEASGGSTKTFTIGFSRDEYDEVHYAEIAARHFHTEQHTHYLTPQDVVDVLGEVSRAFDEPFGNSSVVPTYYCAKLAKERGIELMLAGDGGDEIFAGNSRYVDQAVFGLYDRVPGPLRRALFEPLLFGLPGLDAWSVTRRARSYVRRANLAMPDRLESYNFYRNAELAGVYDAEMLAAIDPDAPLANLREAYGRTASRDMLQRMMHLDLKITLADNDLRKVGIGCEMAGMPVAYPFLDDEVVEFSAQVPSSLLIRRLERRWFFRQGVKDFLAPETLAKKKHGFGMPFTEWPREHPQLRAIAEDCLAGFKRRHYLRADFLDRLLGDGEHSGLVWDIMLLELWFRDRETTADSFRSDRVVA